jgi:hypothetical protein
VFDVNFTFTWWSFGVPDKFALGLSSFLVFIDFINEFAIQQFLRNGLPYLLGRLIPADERRLIALYNSLDVDGDKNLSQEELKKGMERLQKISQLEAKRCKGNTAAAMLQMATYLSASYKDLVHLDELDVNTKSSSGFTLPTLLKAYRASKRRHPKAKKHGSNAPVKAAVVGGNEIDFSLLEDALDQLAHKQFAFKVDNSADDKSKMNEMKLGMRIKGLRATEVLPNSQSGLGGVAKGDVITKIIDHTKTVKFPVEIEAAAGEDGLYNANQQESLGVDRKGKVRVKGSEEALQAEVTKLLIDAHKDKNDITVIFDTSARSTSTFDKGKRQLSNIHGSFKKASSAAADDAVSGANKAIKNVTGVSIEEIYEDGTNTGEKGADAETGAEDHSDAAEAVLGTMITYETFFFKGNALTHAPIDTLNAAAGDKLEKNHQVTWKSKTPYSDGTPDYKYGVITKVKDAENPRWEFKIYEKKFVEELLPALCGQNVEWDAKALEEQTAQDAPGVKKLTEEWKGDEPGLKKAIEDFKAEAPKSDLTTKNEKRVEAQNGSTYTYEDEELTGGWTKPKEEEAVGGDTAEDEAKTAAKNAKKKKKEDFEKARGLVKMKLVIEDFIANTTKGFNQFIVFADRMVTIGKVTTFAVSYLCYVTALFCYLIPTLVTYPSVIFVFIVAAWVWFSVFIGFIVILTLLTLLLWKRSPHLIQRWLSEEWWIFFKLPELTPLIAPHHLMTLFSNCIYYTSDKDIEVDGKANISKCSSGSNDRLTLIHFVVMYNNKKNIFAGGEDGGACYGEWFSSCLSEIFAIADACFCSHLAESRSEKGPKSWAGDKKRCFNVSEVSRRRTRDRGKYACEYRVLEQAGSGNFSKGS